jgi:hypothetical protein
MNTVAAHHLLGNPGDGSLILLAGPDYARTKSIAVESGMSFQELREVVDPALLRAEIAHTGRSVVVIASMYEVEGRLDRSAFDGRLTELAYEADRVVYAGTQGAALVWPEAPDTERRVNGGYIQVIKRLDVVAS